MFARGVTIAGVIMFVWAKGKKWLPGREATEALPDRRICMCVPACGHGWWLILSPSGRSGPEDPEAAGRPLDGYQLREGGREGGFVKKTSTFRPSATCACMGGQARQAVHPCQAMSVTVLYCGRLRYCMAPPCAPRVQGKEREGGWG